jgi:hypothetical protein
MQLLLVLHIITSASHPLTIGHQRSTPQQDNFEKNTFIKAGGTSWAYQLTLMLVLPPTSTATPRRPLPAHPVKPAQQQHRSLSAQQHGNRDSGRGDVQVYSLQGPDAGVRGGVAVVREEVNGEQSRASLLQFAQQPSRGQVFEC